jgi:hypothetical protein
MREDLVKDIKHYYKNNFDSLSQKQDNLEQMLEQMYQNSAKESSDFK